MAVDLERMRQFCGTDPDADTTALEMCLKAAVSWYEAAGVPRTTTGDDYDFWVANLGAWFYDHRGDGTTDFAIPQYFVVSKWQMLPRGKHGAS